MKLRAAIMDIVSELTRLLGGSRYYLLWPWFTAVDHSLMSMSELEVSRSNMYKLRGSKSSLEETVSRKLV